MLKRHAETANKLQEAGDLILDEFNERLRVRGGMKGIDGRTLMQLVLGAPKMLDTGQKLERLAEGEATERHEHIITADQIAKMTDEEFDRFVREQGLA